MALELECVPTGRGNDVAVMTHIPDVPRNKRVLITTWTLRVAGGRLRQDS